MDYLDRNTLPTFQERLDLSASELNAMEDVIVEAINELAGRIYIMSNMIPLDQREQYAQELSYLLLDTMSSLQSQIDDIRTTVQTLSDKQTSDYNTLLGRIEEFEARLNALDDAAARKEDLNVLLWRSGEE